MKLNGYIHSRSEYIRHVMPLRGYYVALSDLLGYLGVYDSIYRRHDLTVFDGVADAVCFEEFCRIEENKCETR